MKIMREKLTMYKRFRSVFGFIVDDTFRRFCIRPWKFEKKSVKKVSIFTISIYSFLGMGPTPKMQESQRNRDSAIRVASPIELVFFYGSQIGRRTNLLASQIPPRFNQHHVETSTTGRVQCTQYRPREG